MPLLCGAQGDANRSDTDEDKTSTHLEDDVDKFRDLRATGVCGDDGEGLGRERRPCRPCTARGRVLGGVDSFAWEPCRREWPPPPPEMKMYSLAVTPNGHLEGRGSLPPPVIMHTAATPRPTPKSSPNLDTANSLLDSRRGSSSSVDPQLGDQKSLVGSVSCPGLRAPSGSCA